MAVITIPQIKNNAGKWVIFDPASASTWIRFTDNVEAAREEYMKQFGAATTAPQVTLFRIPEIIYDIKRGTRDVPQITES